MATETSLVCNNSDCTVLASASLHASHHAYGASKILMVSELLRYPRKILVEFLFERFSPSSRQAQKWQCAIQFIFGPWRLSAADRGNLQFCPSVVQIPTAFYSRPIYCRPDPWLWRVGPQTDKYNIMSACWGNIQRWKEFATRLQVPRALTSGPTAPQYHDDGTPHGLGKRHAVLARSAESVARTPAAPSYPCSLSRMFEIPSPVHSHLGRSCRQIFSG